MKHLFKKLTSLTAVLTLLLALIPTQPTHAQPTGPFPNTPVADFPTTNGTVYDVLPMPDGSAYVAGDFNVLNPYGARRGVSMATDTAIPDQSPVFNNTVNTVIPDGSDGWYAGGSFTAVDGQTRNRLAHILPDGTLDPDFDPNLNSIVSTLALSSDGQTLYVGGSFAGANSVNGNTTRNRLAAFSTSTGTVTSFNPNISNTVLTLALTSDDSTLYVGGAFNGANSVNGNTTRNRLAAFSTSTGTVTSFNPNISNTVNTLALSSDGQTLYAGGAFNGANSVNGNTTRNRVAAFSTSTGTVISFNPNITNNGVSSLVLDSDNDILYAGGSFTTVNGSTTRNRLAAFDTSTGTATSFDPNISNVVYTLALSPDGSTLYAGGNFNGANSVNSNTTRDYLAAFNTDTGAVTSFDPNVDKRVYSLALSPDDETLYIGGEFTASGGVPAPNNLIHILPDGTLSPDFNANINTSGTSRTIHSLALSPDGSTLYAGGYMCTTAFNAATGTVIWGDPSSNACSYPIQDIALSPDGFTLYETGINIAGARVRNALTGSVLTTFSTTNPGFATMYSLALSPDGEILYVSGNLTAAGGQPRNSLAAFNTSDGTVASFNPNVNSTAYGLIVSPDGETLYAGGSFTTVNGSTTRNRLAAFSTDTGIATSFNPNIANGQVNALILDSDTNTLYAGGSFSSANSVNGNTTRNYLAAFSTDTGTITSFDPNLNSTVRALALDPETNRLYTGGDFSTVNGQPRSSLAAFQGPLYHKELSNAEGGAPVLLETPYATNITCSDTLKESDATTQDPSYNYPLGLVEFCFDTDETDNEVSLTFVTDLTPDQVIARKYNSTTNTYFDIPNATITQTTYQGQAALQLTYTITDNGELDLDPDTGAIKDPVGLAMIVDTGAASGNGALASTGMNIILLSITALLGIGGAGFYLRRRYF